MTNTGARIIIACTIVAIFAANAYAIAKHLYFYIWWLDIPMHIVGGFWIGYAALAIIQVRAGHTLPIGQRIRYALLFSCGVGLLWEMLEFVSDRSFALEPYVYNIKDSVKDLCDDFIGGLAAGVLGKIHQHRLGGA
jgi:hypothetical protein